MTLLRFYWPRGLDRMVQELSLGLAEFKGNTEYNLRAEVFAKGVLSPSAKKAFDDWLAWADRHSRHYVELMHRILAFQNNRESLEQRRKQRLFSRLLAAADLGPEARAIAAKLWERESQAAAAESLRRLMAGAPE